MKSERQVTQAAVLAVAIAGFSSLPASAAEPGGAYPTKPVRVVVAFAAGGFADGVARQIGQKLSESLGQQFIIDNRGGAGGTYGAKIVMTAVPDGYTLLVNTASAAVNATLYKDPGFDLIKDFTPVAMTVSGAGLFVVPSTHPAKDLKDLIRLSQGKRLTYGTAGVGTSSHIAGDYLLRLLAKLDAVHVPFKGGGPAMAAVLGGQVDVLSGTGTAAIPLIKQGRMRALAISSPTRSETLPDVPTVAESGFPGFEERSWVGFFAPAKTPASIVNRINRAINEALAMPDMIENFKSRGLDRHPGSSADFARHLKAEVAMWAKIIKTTGVKAD